MSQINLKTIKKDKLKQLCKKRNLQIGGTKKQLYDRLLNDFTSNCPIRKQPTSRKLQYGGWNPKTEAGIILAHGRQIPGKLVVIPKDMYIRTLSSSGKCPTRSMYVQNDQLGTSLDRGLGFGSDIHDELGGRIHAPGSIIVDLSLEFKATWGSHEEKNLEYVNTGVYTTGNITRQVKSGLNKTDNDIRDDSMSGCDESITPKEYWGTAPTLGQIINKIITAGKAGRYYLNACRKGDMLGDDTPRYCGSEKALQKELRTSTSAIYNQNIHDIINQVTNSVPWKTPDDKQKTLAILQRLKIDDAQFKIKEKGRGILLKMNFIRELAQYMKYRIGKKFDYTINIVELCNFLNIYAMIAGTTDDVDTVSIAVLHDYLNEPSFQKTKELYYSKI